MRGQCNTIERDIAYGTHFSDGAELPGEQEQRLRLIAALNVAIPSARDWPAARSRPLYSLLALPSGDY